MTTLLDILVKEHLADVMRQAGFRKRRRTWNRQGDAVVQVVQVECSRFNVLPCQTFGLLYGIAAPRLQRIVWNKCLPTFVGLLDCVYRENTGFLPGRDLGSRGRPISDSWTAEYAHEVDVVGPQIIEVLTRSVLPFLSEVTCEAELFRLIRQQRQNELPEGRLYRHAAEYLSGDRHLAMNGLAELVAENEDWRDRIELVRRNLEAEPPP